MGRNKAYQNNAYSGNIKPCSRDHFPGKFEWHCRHYSSVQKHGHSFVTRSSTSFLFPSFALAIKAFCSSQFSYRKCASLVFSPEDVSDFASTVLSTWQIGSQLSPHALFYQHVDAADEGNEAQNLIDREAQAYVPDSSSYQEGFQSLFAYRECFIGGCTAANRCNCAFTWAFGELSDSKRSTRFLKAAISLLCQSSQVFRHIVRKQLNRCLNVTDALDSLRQAFHFGYKWKW